MRLKQPRHQTISYTIDVQVAKSNLAKIAALLLLFLSRRYFFIDLKIGSILFVAENPICIAAIYRYKYLSLK
jgi:hypothetical protein